jgi:hypothetical protein
MENYLPILIMSVCPGAGKSEITNFHHQITLEERRTRFHIDPMHVLDDFSLLWTWFEEDDLQEYVFHRPQLHTTTNRYVLHNDMWHLLIQRLNLEHSKWRRDTGGEGTAIIEFSRGVNMAVTKPPTNIWAIQYYNKLHVYTCRSLTRSPCARTV